MKVGIVCYPTVGGSGVLATELGHELAVRGHEVHFITYAIPFRLRMEENNIYFHEVQINQYDLFQYPDYALTLAVKIADVARSHHLDVLHVHYAIPHATSAYLANMILGTDRPAVITTLHGTDITLVGRDPSYQQVVEFSMEMSDKITAVSKDLKQQTIKHFNISKDIDVVYNFFIPKKQYLDCNKIKSKFCPNREKLLIHASNYRPVKRSEDVFDIYKKVHQKMPSKLILLGSGEGLGKIREKAEEADLQDHVFFIGKTTEIDPYISASDLFLLPSEQESFGLVALESMAYGTPVIASDVGGIPEVVEHGKSGFLAPVGSTDQMAEYALDLLSNEALYLSFSEVGRHTAETKFSADVIVSQYEALYKSVAL